MLQPTRNNGNSAHRKEESTSWREGVASSLAAQNRDEREPSVELGSQADEKDLEESSCAPEVCTQPPPHEGGPSPATQMTTPLVVKLVRTVLVHTTKCQKPLGCFVYFSSNLSLSFEQRNQYKQSKSCIVRSMMARVPGASMARRHEMLFRVL